ncbi:hypothetical protein JL720_11873 [Aureococcus anophagefferens]|nr:hypothetical protein JL720_11873 [Aureococcus anophagefferens]
MHRFVLLMVKTGAGAATTGAAAAAARIVFPAPYAVNVGGDALVDVLVEGPDPAPAELWVDGVRACPAPGACDSDVCPDGRAGEAVVLRVAPPRPALNIGQWHLDPGSFGDSADWRRLAAKADNLRYFTTLRLNGALGCASLAPALAQILVDAAFFDAESLGPDGDWVTAAVLGSLSCARDARRYADPVHAGQTPRAPAAALSRVQKALTFRVPAALAFEALGAAGFEGLGGRSRDAAFAKVSDSDEAASVTLGARARRGARGLGAVWRVGGELWAHGAAPTDAPSNSWSACFVEELDGTRQFHDYLDDEGARGALVGLKGLLEAALALARARVVHRDLGSWNVLVDSQDRVRVVDFGWAAALDDDGVASAASPFGDAIHRHTGLRLNFRPGLGPRSATAPRSRTSRGSRARSAERRASARRAPPPAPSSARRAPPGPRGADRAISLKRRLRARHLELDVPVPDFVHGTVDRCEAARDAFFFTGRRLADLAALAASDPPVVNGRVVVRRRAGVAGDDKTAGGWDSFRDLLFYLNATVAYVVYRNGAACVAGRCGDADLLVDDLHAAVVAVAAGVGEEPSSWPGAGATRFEWSEHHYGTVIAGRRGWVEIRQWDADEGFGDSAPKRWRGDILKRRVCDGDHCEPGPLDAFHTTLDRALVPRAARPDTPKLGALVPVLRAAAPRLGAAAVALAADLRVGALAAYHAAFLAAHGYLEPGADAALAALANRTDALPIFHKPGALAAPFDSSLHPELISVPPTFNLPGF